MNTLQARRPGRKVGERRKPPMFETPIRRAIGELIHSQRTRRGLRQKDLAKAAGYHESSIMLAETGERLPNIEMLADILETLDYEIVFQPKPRDQQ